MKRMLTEAEKVAASAQYDELGREASELEDRARELREQQRALMYAVMFGVDEKDPR